MRIASKFALPFTRTRMVSAGGLSRAAARCLESTLDLHERGSRSSARCYSTAAEHTIHRLDMREPGAAARFRELELQRRPAVLLGLTDGWPANRWDSFASLAADLGGATKLYCKVCA